MSMVKAKLRVLDLRGDTVHTRWGHVTFDKDGLAELEVPEEELDMLRQTKPFPWLHEPAEAPVSTPEDPKGEDGEGETGDAVDDDTDEDGDSDFDVSDATPAQGTKKKAKKGSRK